MSIIWFINNKVNICSEVDCITKASIRISATALVPTASKYWRNQMMPCTWIEVYRLMEEMVGYINQWQVQTFMGAIPTSRKLERLGLKILNVLNAKTIMIYASLRSKKVAVCSLINSKHKSRSVLSSIKISLRKRWIKSRLANNSEDRILVLSTKILHLISVHLLFMITTKQILQGWSTSTSMSVQVDDMLCVFIHHSNSHQQLCIDLQLTIALGR